MELKLKIYNTFKRKKEVFKPIKKGEVSIYTCGPTVYDFAHIGNLRTYIFEDVLVRALKTLGFKVKRVLNITDVGHLTDDEDAGEDKVEKSAKKAKKTARQIAIYFEKQFMLDMTKLNIEKATFTPRASDFIPEMIKFIQKLEVKKYTYLTSDGVYFDSTRVPNYDQLAKIDIKGLEEGKRVTVNKEKKHKTDFALWKFSPKNSKRQMEWESPWSPSGRDKVKGFPGWHIECSVLAQKFLGDKFDIHCGGVDHISVHHTNEIAQSYALTKKIPAVYWCHGQFLTLDGEKMAKSKNHYFTLDELEKKGFEPMDFRFMVLNNHYRSRMEFSLKELEKSRNTRLNIRRMIQTGQTEGKLTESEQKAYQAILERLMDDLNTPCILDMLHSCNSVRLWLKFEPILGLGFKEEKNAGLTEKQQKLIKEREVLRQKKQYEKADNIRKLLQKQGIELEDRQGGTKYYKI